MAQASKNSALVVASLLGVVTPGAFCGEWTASAGVSPQIVLTDNVCLSPDDEQSDIYGIVTPSVSVNGDGNRANFTFSTSVDFNSLTNNALAQKGCGNVSEEREQYRPQLSSTAFVEMVENWLFLDADATISQNEISPFVAGGGDPEDRTGNTNTTVRYSISPYVSRRFKDVATLLLRYTYDDQYNSKEIVGNSVQDTVLLSLDSIPGTSRFIWGLQANYNNVNYAETAGRPSIDSELASAQINLGFQINRSWKVNGYYGVDENDFVSAFDETDGDFWSAGVAWTPNSRTSVSIGTGDRFFGNTPYFSISRSHRRSLFTADYAKTITYTRNLRTVDGGLPGSTPGQPTTLSASPIIDERFSLGYSYQGRRTTLGIGSSVSEQTRTLNGRSSTFANVTLNMSHPLSRRMSLSGGLTWSTNNPDGVQDEFFVESQTWRANLSLSRPINSTVNLSLDYQFTDNRSDSPLNEYTENRLTLRISFSI